MAMPALGNDSAASVAVGGIQLKREARISMEKERLTISSERVTVEYEFLNMFDVPRFLRCLERSRHARAK
jgi:hypothetical protein